MAFCIKCGALIPDGGKLCVNCQQRQAGPFGPGPQAQAGPAPGAGGQAVYRLTVARKDQYFLINPTMKVFIDGVERLHVDNGVTLWVDLPAGMHVFSVKSGFRKMEMPIHLSQNLMLVLSWNCLLYTSPSPRDP